MRNEAEIRGLLGYLNTKPVGDVKQFPGMNDLGDKDLLLMMGGMVMMLRWVLGEGPNARPPGEQN
ncbi:MAG: hypothetical protein Q8O55_08915 [Dehalococcoidales bacterium]|nr:hypothetical protein [Dehalococcoidales bacterium]